MRGDRLARIAAVLGGSDDRAAVARLLDATVEILPIEGASVAVVGDGEHLGTLAVAGEGAAAVDDLQFDLGEGPCVSVDHSQRNILEPDLAFAGVLWPAFAPAAVALGVGAVFAFPLRVGAVRLGVLSLYAAAPGDLERGDLADAIAISRVATHLVLELQHDLPPGFLPDRLADIADHRAIVHQATGMVAAQLGADVATALGRIRAYAWSRDLLVADVAAAVVARRLRFDDR